MQNINNLLILARQMLLLIYVSFVLTFGELTQKALMFSA